jgi:hypothetical protein
MNIERNLFSTIIAQENAACCLRSLQTTNNHNNVTDVIANVSTSASDGGGLGAASNETAAEDADEYDPNVAYLLTDGKD